MIKVFFLSCTFVLFVFVVFVLLVVVFLVVVFIVVVLINVLFVVAAQRRSINLSKCGDDSTNIYIYFFKGVLNQKFLFLTILKVWVLDYHPPKKIYIAFLKMLFSYL